MASSSATGSETRLRSFREEEFEDEAGTGTWLMAAVFGARLCSRAAGIKAAILLSLTEGVPAPKNAPCAFRTGRRGSSTSDESIFVPGAADKENASLVIVILYCTR